MDLFQAIKERRSIRQYKLDPVKDEDLETVLKAASYAPSWANTQCWEFIVVKDSNIKKMLSETLLGNNPATGAFASAPIILVACARLGLSGFKKGVQMTDKKKWFMFDLALAIQNLTLAAHSLGLGTVHVGLFDAKEVAQILNVPETIAVVELMPLGYPAETPAERPRKELKDIVFYNKYGQK